MTTREQLLNQPAQGDPSTTTQFSSVREQMWAFHEAEQRYYRPTSPMSEEGGSDESARTASFA